MYDGTGGVTVSGDASATSSQPGRLALQLKQGTGFEVRVTNTSASDPVRNIRIVPVAAEDGFDRNSTVWNPKFLEQVSGNYEMWEVHELPNRGLEIFVVLGLKQLIASLM
jgi:hypothetical protein